ncbi:3-hexulose-6-phosphate synthase [Escherichia coli]|nr:3-hexulose-6-phosphate synthase [Escherichia coli]
MKLQLALDTDSLDKALRMCEKVADHIDIIEIGTPLIYEEGMRAVRAFRKHFRHLEILADLKIMDGGSFEAMESFEAGADYCTVLGVTDLLTAKGAIEEANKWGRKIVFDFICVPDMPTRIRQLEELGSHVLAVHVGTDQQAAGRTPLDDLKVMVAHRAKSEVSVAGGINSSTIHTYAALKPDIVIVGNGLTGAKDPVSEALKLREAMRAY